MTTIFNENGAKKIFFKLKEDFINKFKRKQPKWGPVGYITYKRTYSREISNGKSEEYWQTIERVVNGVFTIQKRHCHIYNLPWSEAKAKHSAEKMYQLMWDFKFTPPGRGLWMMGTETVYEKGIVPLVNCSFVTTENINIDFAEPFTYMMDLSMLGVGVGSDIRGTGKITIRQPKYSVDVSKGEEDVFVVKDTREGWVSLLERLLNAYVGKESLPTKVDYSKVRPAGSIIKSFGGIASGSGPLKEMYVDIKKLLNTKIGQKIDESTIVDIFNLVGRCIVSGGIRRTAQIMFGEHDNEKFMELKDPEKYEKELIHHRWCSNNSIFAKVGMDYNEVVKKTIKNGEPGYVWLENAQKYSRMIDSIDNKDKSIMGSNPCITGDNIVAVADGRNGVSIKQLAEESNGKNKFKVFSGKKTFYGNQFGSSKTFSTWKKDIKNAVAFKTGTKKIITLILSDGSSISCTPDHLLATIDGRYIRADQSEGIQIAKFYSFSDKNTKKSYRHINSISDGHSLEIGVPKREDKNIYMNTPIYIDKIIDDGKIEDVYDLTVEDNNNFYIISNTDDSRYLNSSGILIHNCGEIFLNSRELCNLAESYPSNHDTLEEWIETLKYSYMYSKTVTLLPSHNKNINATIMKNRRVGISVTGIVQAFNKFGRRNTLNMFDKGYKKLKEWDDTYSDWLGIPKSIKLSTTKPSGTTSLLPGVTPGIHYPVSEYYIRNIRFQKGNPLLDELKNAGYKIEKDIYSENTYVVSFPVKEQYFDKSIEDVTIWEQLQNAADIQKYWADNAVSVTVSFSKKEESQLATALSMFEDKLKGVSFLPKKDHGYKQAPYIPITKEEYEKMIEDLKKVKIKENVHDQVDKFCDGTSCDIEITRPTQDVK